MAAIQQQIVQDNVIKGKFERGKVEMELFNNASRLGHENWRNKEKGNKAPGFPRREIKEHSGKEYHPGMLPFDFIKEVEALDTTMMKPEDIRNWFEDELSKYVTTREFDYEDFQIVRDHLYNKLDPKWFPDKLYEWIKNLKTDWVHRNDNWGEIAVIFAKKELNIDITDENSINTQLQSKFDVVYKLKDDIDQITKTKNFQDFLKLVDTNPTLRDLMILTHKKWREDNNKPLTFDFGKYDDPSSEETNRKLLNLRINIEKWIGMNELPDQIILKNSLRFYINLLRTDLHKNSAISASESFRFLINSIQILEEALPRIRSKIRTEETKQMYERIEGQIKETIDILFNTLQQDANPAVPDAIMDLIKSHGNS